MLTHRKIENLRKKNSVYRVADSRGLAIEIRPKTGAKLWRYRYRFAGVPKMIGLGEFPEVTLADARDKRDRMRLMVREGQDPAIARKQERQATQIAQSNTVAAIAREWLERQDVSPATEKKNRWLLDHYLIPALGNRPISEVTPRELLDVLRKPESEGKIETANRLQNKCKKIWRFAIVEGRAENDIASPLKDGLKSPKVNHHAAVVEPELLGKVLRAIDGYDGQPATRAALKLAPMLFQRPGELRKAKWADVDLEAAEWRFTSDKTGLQHLVPLPPQAVAILRELHKLTGRGEYVFPSNRRGRPMSENTINAALRTLGFTSDQVTGHGFRATARTMLDEKLGVEPHLIDHQLGHVVRDPNGRAYNRTTHLPERREMMAKWADYLEGLKG